MRAAILHEPAGSKPVSGLIRASASRPTPELLDDVLAERIYP